MVNTPTETQISQLNPKVSKRLRKAIRKKLIKEHKPTLQELKRMQEIDELVYTAFETEWR